MLEKSHFIAANRTKALRYTLAMAKSCPEHKLEDAEALFEDDPELGLETFEELYHTYPSDLNVRMGLAWALGLSGDPEGALEHLEFVAARHKGGAVHEKLAVVYVQLAMPTHAAQAVRKARERGKFLDAAFDQIRMPEGFAQKDLLELERASLDVRIGRLQGVTALLERFLQRYPTHQSAWLTLGVAQFSNANFDRARQAFERASEIDPHDPAALHERVRLEIVTRGLDAARALEPALLQLHPADPSMQFALARTWAMLEDHQRVFETCQALRASSDAQGDQSELTEEIFEEIDHLERIARAHLGLEALDGLSTFKKDGFLELKVGIEAYEGIDDWVPLSLRQRWDRVAPEKLPAEIGRSLSALPGVLALVPSRIGFEEHEAARSLAHALAQHTSIQPAPDQTWADALRRIALEGPGTIQGRLDVLAGLIDAKVEAPTTGLEIPAWPHRDGTLRVGFNVRTHKILEGRDLTEYAQAVSEMKRNDFERARQRLLRLLERHPDDTSITFNLINAERQLGLESESFQRLETLLEAHPDYLHGRAQLITLAVIEGDLERAERLQALPEGNETFHVQELVVYGAAIGLIWLERDQDAKALLKLMDLLSQLQPNHNSLQLLRSRFMQKLSDALEDSPDLTEPRPSLFAGAISKLNKMLPGRNSS